MKSFCLRAALAAAMFAFGGCSGSDVKEVAELPTTDALAATVDPAQSLATMTSIKSTSTAEANGLTDDAISQAEPFRNPFAPPKNPPPPRVVEEPEPEPVAVFEPAPEIRQPGTPPKIRLLGFVNSGEPKVLVAYRDKLETLAIGDTLENMKVVHIESPVVTMSFEERELKYSLFDQAWQHAGDRASASNSGRTTTRPRATQPTRATSSEPVRETSGIPGFGPNAGRPPGVRPPTPPVTPPPALPGLSGDTTVGELPHMPGLDIGPGSQLGPGNLPAFPGGL